MKGLYAVLIAFGLMIISIPTMAQGGCSSILESIEAASLDEASQEFLRLGSYKNPYCDTTGSDYEQLMKKLEVLLTEASASKEMVVEKMGTPYYQGALAEYENQKLTIGRNGKPMGKALPPSYKIPTGEYFIVYLWRNKDYLVFALKGNTVTEARWWEKGDYR